MAEYQNIPMVSLDSWIPTLLEYLQWILPTRLHILLGQEAKILSSTNISRFKLSQFRESANLSSGSTSLVAEIKKNFGGGKILIDDFNSLDTASIKSTADGTEYCVKDFSVGTPNLEKAIRYTESWRSIGLISSLQEKKTSYGVAPVGVTHRRA